MERLVLGLLFFIRHYALFNKEIFIAIDVNWSMPEANVYLSRYLYMYLVEEVLGMK